jgi:hypothetical protein
MKKLITFILIISILSVGWAAEKRSAMATLTFYLGQVLVKVNGLGSFMPVQKGMTFYEGDVLKTQDDGKAEIFFYTGSKTRIANGTEIVFQNDEKTKSKSIFLNAGQIWNQIRKGDKFEVESIHGVASVKGTEFDIANNGDEMNLWVVEGLVLVKNDKGELLAERNTHTNLRKGFNPDKKDINRGDLPNWQNNFSAEALLTLSAPGQKQEGKPFKINLTLKDPKTDKLYSDEMKITIKSLSRGLDLATAKDSNEYAQVIEVAIIDGRAELWAKGQPGEHELNFTGKKITGLNLPVKIETLATQRTVELRFTGKDFKDHQIDIKYKTK